MSRFSTCRSNTGVTGVIVSDTNLVGYGMLLGRIAWVRTLVLVWYHIPPCTTKLRISYICDILKVCRQFYSTVVSFRKNEAVLKGSRNFTVLIKNQIAFPRFNFKRYVFTQCTHFRNCLVSDGLRGSILHQYFFYLFVLYIVQQDCQTSQFLCFAFYIHSLITV